MSTPTRFSAILYQISRNRCVDVPDEIAQLLGPGKNPPVRVTVGTVSASTSLMAKKDGGYRLFVAKELRKEAGVDTGEEISLQVEPDPSGGEPDLPPDLLHHLGKIPGAIEALLGRSPADRRQARRWIDSAKTAATRERRLQQLADRLLHPPKRGK